MSLLDRLLRPLAGPSLEFDAPQRAIWPEDLTSGAHIDLLAQFEGVSASFRRANRTPADLASISSSVYSAIKRRVNAVNRCKLTMVRRVGDDVEEVLDHPALTAIRRVNSGLTFKQGWGLIEQHKLTWGNAFWVKRRGALGVPMEFEIWDPASVRIHPDPRTPWAPRAFTRRTSQGQDVTVAAEDVIWFRHILDPRISSENPAQGLAPIEAIRMTVDTGLEATRYNLRFFDNDATPAAIYHVAEAGPSEIKRIRDDFQRKFQGTDNAHRAMITGGGDKMERVDSPISHRDMMFIEQAQLSKEEVAMVYEMSPVVLGDMRHGTFSNTDGSGVDFWETMQDQVSSTLAELNEFLIHRDFGEEYELRADWSTVPALQADRKLSAEIDEINLRAAVITINEVREREGLEPVEWGDLPIQPVNMTSFGTIPVVQTPAQLQQATGAETPEMEPMEMEEERTRLHATPRISLEEALDAMNRGWQSRLRERMRLLFRFLEGVDRKRVIQPEAIEGFDWDWRDDFSPEVVRELVAVMMGTLIAEGFEETQISAVQDLATRYAQERAGEMLAPSGRWSVSATTRERVRALTAKTLEEGQSLRWLKNELRKDPLSFAPARAETIARTETAMAQGRAKLQSYESLAYEGKRWVTAGDERVDGGNPSGPCIENENAGPIRLSEGFPSGHMTVPAHPRCRCTIQPVREMPKRVIKKVIRDDFGEIAAVEELVI